MITSKTMRFQIVFALFLASAICIWASTSLAKAKVEKNEPAPEPTTIKQPDIPIDELELLLRPLTKDELLVEADGWLQIVKTKVEEVSAAEIAVKQKNTEIKKTKELRQKIEEAKSTLNEVKEAAEAAQKDMTGNATQEAFSGAKKAQEVVKEVADKIEEVNATSYKIAQDEIVKKAIEKTGIAEPNEDHFLLSEKTIVTAQGAHSATAEVTKVAEETHDLAVEGQHVQGARKAEEIVIKAEDAQQALHATGEAVKSEVDKSTKAWAIKILDAEKLERINVQAETTVNTDAEIKTHILDAVADLRAERTALIDRFNTVLDELSNKLGKTQTGKDNELVVPFRLYASSVGGIKVDVSDREAALATIIGWLKSDEGGIRWAINLAVFLVTVIAFWVLGRIFGKLAEKAFGATRGGSILLRNFVVHSVRRVTLIIGIIIGLTSLEINIGPLLALIGAAGFVVAFALQNTLSNFASGIMIMLYKPFDVGDLIDVAGVLGVVHSMNLVTTTITKPDNAILVVPNNSIWGNIITNITGSEQRRVDLVFGIGYGDDINQAREVLVDLVEGHPLVLDSPEPVIEVHELGESSVNFICRPWAKTADYWTVYWSLTRAVKERFDAEGISIPFPQRDVHILHESQENAASTHS